MYPPPLKGKEKGNCNRLAQTENPEFKIKTTETKPRDRWIKRTWFY